MCTIPQARTIRANKSSSENVPHECHMFLPVKRSPHLGHFQRDLRFLTADFVDFTAGNSERFLDFARNDKNGSAAPKMENLIADH